MTNADAEQDLVSEDTIMFQLVKVCLCNKSPRITIVDRVKEESRVELTVFDPLINRYKITIDFKARVFGWKTVDPSIIKN